MNFRLWVVEGRYQCALSQFMFLQSLFAKMKKLQSRVYVAHALHLASVSNTEISMYMPTTTTNLGLGTEQMIMTTMVSD